MYDAEWRWVHANPAARAWLGLLGVAPDAVLGRRLWEVFPELRERSPTREAIEAASAGRAATFELYVEALDGHYETRVLPIAGVVSISRDFTEQRRAERALTHATQRLERTAAELEDALARVSDAFYAYDAEWRFVRLNGAARVEVAATGRDPDAVVGRSLWDVFPWIVGGDYEREMRRAMDERVARRFEAETMDGRWIEVQAYPTGGGLAAYTRDVTARRRALETQTLLTQVGDALAGSLDLDDVARVVAGLALPTVADYAVVDLLGDDGALRRVAAAHADPARDAVMTDVRSISPRLDRANVVADVVRTGRPVVGASSPELTRAVSDDTRFLAAIERLGPRYHCCVPMVARGRTLGALLLARTRDGARPPFAPDDVTLVDMLAKRAALSLDNARLYGLAQAALRRADAGNQAKAEFLAVMSHELRTPLNAIAGYAELIELEIHGPITDATRDAVLRIRRSQRHLLGLIDELLGYARLEAGRLEFRLAPVSLVAALGEIEPLVAPQAGARGVALEIAPPENLLMRADPERLRQVVLNLVTNAIKFTEPGGRVRVAAEADRTGSDALIRVADTGAGIPADSLEWIFEPFVQLDASLTRTSSGTGLGLAIARRLARGMGGDVSVERALGAGTTFTVRLPLAAGPAAPA